MRGREQEACPIADLLRQDRLYQSQMPVLQEGAPGLGGRITAPWHVIGHGGLRDIESKFQELAMDPRRGDVSPEAGAPILDEVRRRCVSDGDLYRLIGNDASTAECKVLQGDIGFPRRGNF
jgi:hypothetical protein